MINKIGRYSRQEIFPNIGVKGQIKISKSTISIVGLGALGSRCAELLARAGIGTLNLIDRDIIELDNLQRQTLFEEEDIGKPKAVALKNHLYKINREVSTKEFIIDLDYENIDKLENSDVIICCVDNMYSRFLINEYSISKNIPWINGGIIGSLGTMFSIIPGKTCFRCIFKEADNLPTCDTGGVLNTISSSIASFQVNEAIKIILGKKTEKCLVYFDIWRMEFTKIKVKQNPTCEACNKKYKYLDGSRTQKYIKFCGLGNYQITGKIDNFENLKNRLSKIDTIKDCEHCIVFRNNFIFRDGRALIKADSLEKAKSFYSKYIGN